jgi:3,4-dihydroxy 2-butanone 4-phosphate synthase
MKEDAQMATFVTTCLQAWQLGQALCRSVCLRCPETFFAHSHCEERFTMSLPLSTAQAEFPLLALHPEAVPARIAAALEALRAGRAVVLQDDDDRENEADLIVAAERLTVETMALFIRECSGIVCLCLPEATVRALDLPPMVARNESRHGTGFTVSIEARHGVTTGVSAADRVTTIRAAIAEGAKPEDLARPGHVFPLRAVEGGVLARRGHTEGTVDLAVLAGLKPAGVLCELMNPDGTMARGAEVERFAAAHGLPMLTIAELVAFRESLAQVAVSTCEEEAA